MIWTENWTEQRILDLRLIYWCDGDGVNFPDGGARGVVVPGRLVTD